ncbi:MAG TPA: ATP-binding protein [Candidatus Hydrogenedentes bacterium]|nr:ATP-binding protein [Candidatus Hydrogenedentota bacterium]
MRELSLHLLDILENSVRAGAETIRATIELDTEQNWLTLCVEDDGPGFPVPPERLLDPFFTTKSGKRTGLGLSLFRAAAQQAGGDLRLGTSDMGGALTRATFRYHHLDRAPLGDVPGTFMAILLSNPEIHIICQCRGSGKALALSSREDNGKNADGSPFAAARRFSKRVGEMLTDIGVTA